MVQTLKTYQPNRFIDSYPPTLQITIRRDYPTIEDARTAADVPLINDMVEAYGNKITAGWISKQLLSVVRFVGAKEMTDQQVAELGFQLQFDYGFLNLYEFILFCSLMRSGRYKEFYGVVDPMAIIKSLDMFCQDRFEEHRVATNRRREEQERLERQEHDANLSSFSEWWSKLSDEQKAEYKHLIPTNLIQQWNNNPTERKQENKKSVVKKLSELLEARNTF